MHGAYNVKQYIEMLQNTPYVMLRYVMLCYVMLRYVMLCYAMFHYVMLHYVVTDIIVDSNCTSFLKVENVVILLN